MSKTRLNDYLHLRTENLDLMDELKLRELKLYSELDQVERDIKRGINIRRSLMKKQALSHEIDSITAELANMRTDQAMYEEMVYHQQKELNEDRDHLESLEKKLKESIGN